ncbi:hypothetical protein D9619_002347 [Psilocybe cf. subviscida]|uniref:Uncharacterized protein n=1 Tax=Psilocybe cf. subviscida TaxID=2480587 RepID=A0A8H5AWL3_9AGAR|nr:hypothetical protein D9619_002347 [Psilocybe cf. subviscida]
MFYRNVCAHDALKAPVMPPQPKSPRGLPTPPDSVAASPSWAPLSRSGIWGPTFFANPSDREGPSVGSIDGDQPDIPVSISGASEIAYPQNVPIHN